MKDGKLYVMRHGKTEWNAQHRLQGKTDIPLNEEGRRMAQTAREEYLDTHFDLCFCSPLQRARETAELLLRGRDVTIRTDERLVEMSFGDYEGLEYSFQIPDCPINVLFQDPAAYTESIGGAESFTSLFARVDSFLTERALPELRKGKDVLIVAHGALNSAIICCVKQLPISEFWSSGLEQCKLLRLL